VSSTELIGNFSSVTSNKSLSGPLLRKAVTATVNFEVSKELVNGEFRSNKLVNDIKSAYLNLTPKRNLDWMEE
jgi:hypothetical protein